MSDSPQTTGSFKLQHTHAGVITFLQEETREPINNLCHCCSAVVARPPPHLEHTDRRTRISLKVYEQQEPFNTYTHPERRIVYFPLTGCQRALNTVWRSGHLVSGRSWKQSDPQLERRARLVLSTTAWRERERTQERWPRHATGVSGSRCLSGW